MPEPVDPEAFRDFEYAGWQRFARGYHDNFAKLTTQVIGPLLDAVNVGEGVRVSKPLPSCILEIPEGLRIHGFRHEMSLPIHIKTSEPGSIYIKVALKQSTRPGGPSPPPSLEIL